MGIASSFGLFRSIRPSPLSGSPRHVVPISLSIHHSIVQCLPSQWSHSANQSATNSVPCSNRISLCHQVQTVCAAKPSFYATSSITVSLIMSKARSVELTTHPHLVPRLTIRRALPPLRHTSLRCDSLILNVCARLAKHFDDQIQWCWAHGRKQKCMLGFGMKACRKRTSYKLKG